MEEFGIGARVEDAIRREGGFKSLRVLALLAETDDEIIGALLGDEACAEVLVILFDSS